MFCYSSLLLGHSIKTGWYISDVGPALSDVVNGHTQNKAHKRH